MRTAGTRSAILLLPPLLVCACCRPRPPGPEYWGPTESMAAVVAAVNANNQAIPSLWARHDFSANLRDAQGRSHLITGSGTLLYRFPHDLLLEGRKEFVGVIFQVGSNAQRYWLRAPVREVDRMWWGEHGPGEPVAGGEAQMPVRPDLLLEVLAVGPIDTDFARLPAPVMRFSHEADAYTLVWVARLPGRFVAQKEVWYDRSSKRPVRVLLYDGAGRVVLRAQLGRHRQVDVPSLPAAQRPWMATEYRLLFAQTQTRMTFELRDMELAHRAPGGVVVPNDRTFRFPSLDEPGVSQVIRVDDGARR